MCMFEDSASSGEAPMPISSKDGKFLGVSI